MFKTRLVLMALLVAFVVAPVQAQQLDSMDDIAARPWIDDRDASGQARPGWLNQNQVPAIEGCGSMGIDYGVTNDSAGEPNPLSGWDYLGNWVGVGAPMGCWGDPAICDYWWTPWCNSYYGDFDRVPSGPFTFAELGILSTCDVISLEVYKTIANSPEHVRELQLYDNLGNRNTYSVQAEATAVSVGAGWKTYYVCLGNALENNADLTDIADIKFWVSSWSFAPMYPGAVWPEYIGGRPTGTEVKIDDLQLHKDLACTELEVLVDIKPESCPNPFVVKGRGVLAAAILGSCTLDVTDIDAASIELAGATALRSEVRDVGGPAAVVLDDMDNIAARPWADLRDPQEGTGWLSQGKHGVMKIDYGVTNDSAGVPHPDSGWDYLGKFVGVGKPGGAWGDPAICNYWWTPWCNSYYGAFDREISAPFTFAELGILTTADCFLLDVYKSVANGPEHVRELQLYDSLGNRNTYSVQAEATAISVGAGWKTYAVCLSNALENNADLTDIVKITLWVSSWSFAPNYPCAVWPEYTGGRPTGTPVLIDNLRLVRAHSPDCGDCLTGADGFDDLVLKFNRADIVGGLGAVHHGDVVDLDLTGNLVTHQPIVGSDCVNIVGKADPAQRPPKK